MAVRPALAFFVLSAALVALLSRDFLPPPYYSRVNVGPNPVRVAGSVSLAFTPQRAPCGVWLITDFPAPGRELLVRVWEDERELRQVVFRRSGAELLDLSGLTDNGRLRLDFSSSEPNPRLAPALVAAADPPALPTTVLIDGVQAPPGTPTPFLLLEYPWPSRWALLLWLVAVPALVLAFRWECCVPVLLVVLGLCATATSALVWQRHYTQHFGHWDADNYGLYAATLAGYFTDPTSRKAARAMLRFHPHAFTPLAPALMAIPIAFGLPRDTVYVEFSALMSFAALCVFAWLLRQGLALPRAAVVLAAVYYACHPLLLQPFARPVTDGLGHVLTLAMLALLLVRVERTRPANTVALALLGLLHAVARPQGIAYVPFIATAVLVADRWREGPRGLGRSARSAAVVAFPPLAILGVLYLTFGWARNVASLLALRDRFRDAYTPAAFAWCLVAVVQLSPLVWCLRPAIFRDRRVTLLLLWAGYYLTTLVVGRAPFWPRHFLPTLPAAMLLTALALGTRQTGLRVVGGALVLALAVASVAGMVHQALTFKALPASLRLIVPMG